MALYFIRHGESTNNLKKLFTGRLDPPLTKKGEDQARAEAGAIKALGEIDKIVSSPLGRALRTAEIVAENLGYSKHIEIDERVIEYDIGELAGKPWRKISAQEFSSLKNVENPGEFKKRLTEFLEEYKDVEGNVLLISHGGVYRMIEAARLGLDPAEFHHVDRPKNASYIELELSWLNRL